MIEIRHRYTGAVLLTLDRADLQGANLQGANLQGADLRGADLRGADLQGANLQGADLQGADLRDANLRGANLQSADLQSADLEDADLEDANLQGADLYGADLRDADLQGAIGVIAGGAPDAWHAHGWLRNGFLSIRVDCKEKRLRDARRYWANKKHRREVLAAVEYIAVIAKIRGWRLHSKR